MEKNQHLFPKIKNKNKNKTIKKKHQTIFKNHDLTNSNTIIKQQQTIKKIQIKKIFARDYLSYTMLYITKKNKKI